jgi:hypothetical protein
METVAFWFIVLFGGILLYRLISQRMATPRARVAVMLRRFQSFQRLGLSETESLFRVAAARNGWKELPHRFLREIIARLGNKEDTIRFITLAEDRGHVKEIFPSIARKIDVDEAMTDVACLLSRFGYELQKQGRLKEAEFVQKLALPLAPDCYFTNLPLAGTYYETGRFSEARPLFERGLAELEKLTAADGAAALSPTRCLAPDLEIAKLRGLYRGKYDALLRASRGG